MPGPDQDTHGIGQLLTEINKEYQQRFDTEETIFNFGDNGVTIGVENDNVGSTFTPTPEAYPSPIKNRLASSGAGSLKNMVQSGGFVMGIGENSTTKFIKPIEVNPDGTFTGGAITDLYSDSNLDGMVGFGNKVAIAATGGARFWDVSDPFSPEAFTLNGVNTSSSVADDIDRTKNGRYLVAAIDSAFHVLRPDFGAGELVKVGEYNPTGSSIFGVSRCGKDTFAVRDGANVTIVDISDKQNPAEIGTVDTQPNWSWELVANDHDSYVFTVDHYGAITSIDISDPANPTVVYRTTEFDNHRQVEGIALEGRYLYMALYGLTSVVVATDLTQPDSPVTMWKWNDGGSADGLWPVCVAKGYLFTSGDGNGNVYALGSGDTR